MAWYVPASHGSHAAWPASGCTVPALQYVWLSAPTLQKEPAGQEVHWLLLPSPVLLLNVPSRHGSGAEAPCSQYEPATHSKHAVLPMSFMNVPGPQSEQ